MVLDTSEAERNSRLVKSFSVQRVEADKASREYADAFKRSVKKLPTATPYSKKAGSIANSGLTPEEQKEDKLSKGRARLDKALLEYYKALGSGVSRNIKDKRECFYKGSPIICPRDFPDYKDNSDSNGANLPQRYYNKRLNRWVIKGSNSNRDMQPNRSLANIDNLMPDERKLSYAKAAKKTWAHEILLNSASVAGAVGGMFIGKRFGAPRAGALVGGGGTLLLANYALGKPAVHQALLPEWAKGKWDFDRGLLVATNGIACGALGSITIGLIPLLGLKSTRVAKAGLFITGAISGLMGAAWMTHDTNPDVQRRDEAYIDRFAHWASDKF